jgi:hypothetical protein
MPSHFLYFTENTQNGLGILEVLLEILETLDASSSRAVLYPLIEDTKSNYSRILMAFEIILSTGPFEPSFPLTTGETVPSSFLLSSYILKMTQLESLMERVTVLNAK